MSRHLRKLLQISQRVMLHASATEAGIFSPCISRIDHFQQQSHQLHTTISKDKFYNPFRIQDEKRRPLKKLISIDLECTCDSPIQIYPMEIIELACVKLDLAIYNRESTFHEYVKPTENPQLTLFCTDLTGIMQPVVDKSDEIKVVVERLLLWMHNINLISDDYQEKMEDFSFVSCGNYDLKCLEPEVRKYYGSQGKKIPIFFKEWINVKKPFVQVTHQWPRGLFHMLEILGETPSGNLHSAMDDSLNLTKVVEILHKRGCEFFPTTKLSDEA